MERRRPAKPTVEVPGPPSRLRVEPESRVVPEWTWSVCRKHASRMTEPKTRVVVLETQMADSATELPMEDRAED